MRCGECGKEFSTKTRAARYCSDGCRLEAQRRKSRECMQRYLADLEERARIVARSRARAAALREKRRKERGQGRRRAPPDGRGPARAPRAAPNSGRHAVCRLCGTAFAPYGGTTTRAYCKACTAKADRETSMVLTVRCGECGKEFSTKNRAARYCSDGCRAVIACKRAREYARRRLADPEKRAVAAARTRARSPPAGDARGAAAAEGGGAAAAATARIARSAPPQPRPLPSSPPSLPPLVSLMRIGLGAGGHGGSRGRHVYCKRCRDRADREIAKVPRLKCRECGMAFTAAGRLARCCSDACRAAGARRLGRERHRRRMADSEERSRAAARRRVRRALEKGKGKRASAAGWPAALNAFRTARGGRMALDPVRSGHAPCRCGARAEAGPIG